MCTMLLLSWRGTSGMQPVILLAVTALICVHMQQIAACPRSQSAAATLQRHLTASAGPQLRHLAQLAPLPTPAATSTASATSTSSARASATATATATATASGNASGDAGEYPSFGECQTAAVAFAGAGPAPGGKRRLLQWAISSSSKKRSLLNMQDYYKSAAAAANTSGAPFGSPQWQNAFIASCASQASGSAGSPGGRRLLAVGK